MNYQEWKRENPRKSINDYFKEFPEKKGQISTPPPAPINISPPIIVSKETTSPFKSYDILLILASILIIVAFFLPWINIKLLSLDLVNSSGSEVPNILKYGYPDNTHLERFGKAIYLIPIGALLVIIGEASKSFFLKATGSALVLIISSISFYALYAMYNNAIDQFGISASITNFYALGIYLTLAGSLYYLFDIIKGFFD